MLLPRWGGRGDAVDHRLRLLRDRRKDHSDASLETLNVCIVDEDGTFALDRNQGGAGCNRRDAEAVRTLCGAGRDGTDRLLSLQRAADSWSTCDLHGVPPLEGRSRRDRGARTARSAVPVLCQARPDLPVADERSRSRCRSPPAALSCLRSSSSAARSDFGEVQAQSGKRGVDHVDEGDVVVAGDGNLAEAGQAAAPVDAAGERCCGSTFSRTGICS